MPPKLTGRAFYESIGRPKYVVAPMVDRSEFAWRLLTRSYLDEERSKSLLAYTPMMHARLFRETARFRDDHFLPKRGSLETRERPVDAEAWLDGNPELDRPLFVQFCANKPEDLLDAAQYVAPYCDAVDLNLGCPQGIARSGHYGAFLQEDWDTIYRMINKLHNELSVPVTAKMRILETREKTLEYAKMILSAGASILTVHGRRREQKGHNTGIADWTMIRYLRDNLPPETVLFANGNILNSGDLEACLAATGADAIMSAEGNLSDPTIFARQPKEHNPREYWYGPDGKGGYRVDAVFRRYLDIIHRYSLDKEPPARKPLYIPGDPPEPILQTDQSTSEDQPSKKRKRGDKPKKQKFDPSVRAIQGHLFQLMRPLITIHTDIRDTLAKTRAGDIEGFEEVLHMVEGAVKRGLDGYESTTSSEGTESADAKKARGDEFQATLTPKQKTEQKYRRPWWVCQPHIRPLPEEALQNGALKISKKETAKLQLNGGLETTDQAIRRTDDFAGQDEPLDSTSRKLPQPALVCG
ncbi:tRNA dihydrouridine synthase [Cladophialophora chaetospira]|uniref:tRNA-dihydrouridine(16/17) synthase [NAD(P)(+)] n=1 Tax=Cladophialophora chaetospira TaxID=386627 RepID=A0AA39CQ14_9EURO|nr:tRNA dihydrouridine synthase [Cladophialophora chaetospira]